MRAVDAWAERAACKGQTAAFFPDEKDRAAIARAVAICKGCPVRHRCKEHVLRAGEVEGVWAGMTPAELRLAVRGI